METMTATNAAIGSGRPRRSRRASIATGSVPMECLSADEKKSIALGKSKEQLYNEYKAQKAARLKQHEDVEEQFRKTVENIKMEEVSGLAEEEEEQTSRISLSTFEQPKVSRRMRRASMGVTLKILDAPQIEELQLEEIDKFVMPPSSPTSTNLSAATPPLGGIFTGDSGMSAIFNAEALAGWKTVTFEQGPLGFQLEPTAGKKACRVTGFIDTAGHPSQARVSGKIEFNDVIVKVNGAIPKSFDETLGMLTKPNEQGLRLITFRPAFGYELEGLPPIGSTKASKGSGYNDTSADASADEYGYGDDQQEAEDYGYGYEDATPTSRKAPSPKPAKKEKSSKSKDRRSRRASMGAIPTSLMATDMTIPQAGAAAPAPKLKKPPKLVAALSADEVERPEVDAVAPKKKHRSRRASIACSAPAVEDEVVPSSKSKSSSKKKEEAAAVDYGYGDEAPASPPKEVKKKHRSRRASIAVSAPTTRLDVDEAPKKSKSKKKETAAAEAEMDYGYGDDTPAAEPPVVKETKKKGRSRRASIACSTPATTDEDNAVKSSRKSKKEKTPAEDDEEDPLRKLLGVGPTKKKTSRRASIACSAPVSSAPVEKVKKEKKEKKVVVEANDDDDSASLKKTKKSSSSKKKSSTDEDDDSKSTRSKEKSVKSKKSSHKYDD